MAVYSVAAHLEMIGDRVRTGAFHDALRHAVQPGCTVADIGTGTGLLAIIAARLGARCVYGVEPEGIIEVAREIIATSDVGDRVELLAGMSTDIELPERVDVVVDDISGVLPLYSQAIPSRIDARDRLLADGGVQIPLREPLLLALAEAKDPDRYDSEALSEETLGIDFSAARRYAVNEWRKIRLQPDELLSEPQEWACLDYRTVESPNVRGAVSCEMTRGGTANGLCLWFDRDLVEGVGFSNAPGQPKVIYGQAFFPLEQSVPVAAGDRVEIEIEALLVGDDYAWRWRTRFLAGDGEMKASFDQSTAQALPVPLARLRSREVSYRPVLAVDGEVDSFILARMNGDVTLRDIAEQLCERFPDRYAVDGDEAIRRVARLSEAYSS